MLQPSKPHSRLMLQSVVVLPAQWVGGWWFPRSGSFRGWIRVQW